MSYNDYSVDSVGMQAPPHAASRDASRLGSDGLGVMVALRTNLLCAILVVGCPTTSDQYVRGMSSAGFKQRERRARQTQNGTGYE